MRAARAPRVPGGRTGTAAAGFTLIEALLSIVLLSLMASVLSALYFAGLQNIDAQGERALLDSALRSEMESSISTSFDALANGTVSVTVLGASYTITRTVKTMDVDGDGTDDATAKVIELSIVERPELTLATLVVDHEDRVGKI